MKETWEKDFDALFDGMRPKVSNFGSWENEDAKYALQGILDRWWGEAESAYREPLKDFIRKLIQPSN